MHYFKDKKGDLISIDNKYWESVKRNEPWLKECDSRGNELNTPLVITKKSNLAPPEITTLKNTPPPAQDLSTDVIKKVTEPPKAIKVNELEKLKEEKLKTSNLEKTVKQPVTPKKNAKSTGTKRKAKAKKA